MDNSFKIFPSGKEDLKQHKIFKEMLQYIYAEATSSEIKPMGKRWEVFYSKVKEVIPNEDDFKKFNTYYKDCVSLDEKASYQNMFANFHFDDQISKLVACCFEEKSATAAHEIYITTHQFPSVRNRKK